MNLDYTDFIKLRTDLSNYVTSFADLEFILNYYINSFFDTSDDDPESFKTNLYLLNKYGDKYNSLRLDPNSSSFTFFETLLELINNVKIFANKRVRALIVDLNAFSLETQFTKNIQVIIEFNPMGSLENPKLNFDEEINSFYSLEGRGKYNAIDIIRIIIYIIVFILVGKNISDKTKFVKGTLNVFEVLLSVKFIFGIIIPVIGLISVFVKLSSFNYSFSDYFSINTSTQFLVNRTPIYSDVFLRFNHIQILQSVELGMLIYLVSSSILTYLNIRAKAFFNFVQFAFRRILVVLLVILIICCCFAVIAEKIFGVIDSQYDDFWMSLLRVLISSCGYVYLPENSDDINFTSFYIILLYFILVLISHNLIIGMIYEFYRLVILLYYHKEVEEKITTEEEILKNDYLASIQLKEKDGKDKKNK